MCCYMFKTELFLPLFHTLIVKMFFITGGFSSCFFFFFLVTQLFHYGADQFKVLTAAG